MIAGNSTFFYKKERDIDHVCPHTIIYDIDVPYANYDYRFLLKNYYASEGATIDFGDDVISSNLKTDLANEPLTATIYTHRYLSAGTYRVTFDINDISTLKDPRSANNVHWSMFSLYCPSAGTTFEINSAWFSDYNESDNLLNLPNEDRMQETVKIIDFNVGELQTALFYWPIFAGMNDVRMTNRQLQRLETSELKLNFNSIACPVRHLKMTEGLNNYNQNNYAFQNKTAFENANCKFSQLRKFTGNGFNHNLFLNADLADSLSAYTISSVYHTEGNRVIGDEINVNFTGTDIKSINVFSTATKTNTRSYIMLMANAFKDCSYLSSVTLDPKIEKIYDATFINCYSLTNIDCTNIRVINGSAFKNCIELKDITLPHLEDTKDGYNFQGCISLTGVYITGQIGFNDYMFDGCSAIIDFPTEHLSFSSNKIGKYAFRNCKNLKTFNFPDGVTNIDSYAFQYSGLTGLTFPSSFGGFDRWTQSNMFDGCKALKEINFAGNVFDIPTKTFYNCTSLKSIELPSSITTIYELGFGGCSNLSSVILHEGFTTLDAGAFNSCTSLKSLEFPSSFTTLGTSCFNNCNRLSSLTFNSIVMLNSDSFKFGSSSIHRTITLPWNEGEMNGWPWGAPSATTTFIYTGALSLAGPSEDEEPDDTKLLMHLPLTSDFTETVNGLTPTWTAGNANNCSFTTYKEHACMNSPNAFGLQYKNIPNVDLTGDLSISFWFNPKVNGGSTWWTYIRFGEKKTNKALNLAGRYQNYIYGGNEGIDIGQAFGDTTQIPQSAQIGTWHHHVVRYSRSTQIISVYLNNRLIGEQSVNLQLSMASDHLKIGYTNRQCDARYIHGFRMYQSCLSHENIAWLYNHNC